MFAAQFSYLVFVLSQHFPDPFNHLIILLQSEVNTADASQDECVEKCIKGSTHSQPLGR